MRIDSYQFEDTTPVGWRFSTVELSRLNLIVGNTATGKTRFLNTLFNLGRFVVSKAAIPGHWVTAISTENRRYRWEIKSRVAETGATEIEYERLDEIADSGKPTSIITRDGEKFRYRKRILPKLDKTVTSISMLNDESDIAPLYLGFQRVKRRNFSVDASGDIFAYAAFQESQGKKWETSVTKEELVHDRFSLCIKLFYLKMRFTDVFNSLKHEYTRIFPFIKSMDVVESKHIPDFPLSFPGVVPILVLREVGVDSNIFLHDLSSGMKKVLLLLTDLFTMSEESVYLIDEYENSLGMNAIEAFPEVILEKMNGPQLLITSHHPYIINKIPVRNWIVFSRIGSNVTMTGGQALESRYGKSSQSAFIQLVNDSLFVKGVQ